MSRRPFHRLVLLPVVVGVTLWLATSLAPTGTLACSCAGPPEGAPIFSGDEDAVLVGRVGADDGRGVFAFAVERWFRGGSHAVVPLRSGTITFADGTSAIDTCGVMFQSGQHLILTAYVNGDAFAANICSPHAVVDSAEGQVMLAAAVDAFGEGFVPGEPPPQAPGGASSVDLATVAIVAIVALLAIVALGVGVATVGREPSDAGKP